MLWDNGQEDPRAIPRCLRIRWHVTSVSQGPGENLLLGGEVMSSFVGLASLRHLGTFEWGHFPVGSWILGSGAEGAGQVGGQSLGAVRVQLVILVMKMDEITQGEGGE